jgi:hypothetical protein
MCKEHCRLHLQTVKLLTTESCQVTYQWRSLNRGGQWQWQLRRRSESLYSSVVTDDCAALVRWLVKRGRTDVVASWMKLCLLQNGTWATFIHKGSVHGPELYIQIFNIYFYFIALFYGVAYTQFKKMRAKRDTFVRIGTWFETKWALKKSNYEWTTFRKCTGSGCWKY